MIKNIYIPFLFLLIFSCTSSKISNNTGKVIKKSKSIEEIRNDEAIKDEIKHEEFAYLFFDKDLLQPKKTVVSPVKNVKPIEIDSNDYKVIVDWLVEGNKRQIKLKNLKTGEVYVITEGEKNNEIILTERTLFYYKFKIDNTIIKVKR